MINSPPAKGEKFEILELLGEGGFAKTWRAKVLNPSLRSAYGVQEVVIKVPHDDEKALSLATDIQINTLLSLRSKRNSNDRIVHYYGVAPFQNNVVIVMEYMPEGSLRKKLPRARHVSLPVERAVEIAQHMLEGLIIIHGEHIIHRDIKPENVLIDGENAMLSDMGISTVLDRDDGVARTRIGTLDYMAPELLKNSGGSYPMDIWGVGVTLYEMLSGRHPFNYGNVGIRDLVSRICDAAPPELERLCPEVPTGLCDIVHEALSKSPSDRFGSAQSMLIRLQDYKDGGLARRLDDLRVMMRQPDKAAKVEKDLKDLEKRFPNEYHIYQNLGDFYNLCSQYIKAIAVLQQGTALCPDDANLHWSLAHSYANSNKHKEAIASMKEAIRHLPRSEDNRTNMGKILIQAWELASKGGFA